MAVERLNDVLRNHDEQEERMSELHKEVFRLSNARKEVFMNMLLRGKPGYKWFILGIKAFKVLKPKSPRGAFLENYYVAMRYIDDVADGDVPFPEGYASRTDYVLRKLDFVKGKREPEDDIERLLAVSSELAGSFGADFTEESENILKSLLFDANRRGTYQIFSEEDLAKHFFDLDIRGGVKGSLKIFGENPDYFKIIEPLGQAERIYYNLRDFNEDIGDGLINISGEDCARLGITEELLRSGQYESHPGVRTWFREQAEKGLTLMEEYKRKKKINLRMETEIALIFAFELKAKDFMANVARGNFEGILKGTKKVKKSSL
ncbi:MAG: hypothetical protein WC745_00975 [Patescibacteria group bacterium]|jgi:hypothetical protein